MKKKILTNDGVIGFYTKLIELPDGNVYLEGFNLEQNKINSDNKNTPPLYAKPSTYKHKARLPNVAYHEGVMCPKCYQSKLFFLGNNLLLFYSKTYYTYIPLNIIDEVINDPIKFLKDTKRLNNLIKSSLRSEASKLSYNNIVKCYCGHESDINQLRFEYQAPSASYAIICNICGSECTLDKNDIAICNKCNHKQQYHSSVNYGFTVEKETGDVNDNLSQK